MTSNKAKMDYMNKYCDVCNLKFNQKSHYDAHCKSIKHNERKYRKELQKQLKDKNDTCINFLDEINRLTDLSMKYKHNWDVAEKQIQLQQSLIEKQEKQIAMCSAHIETLTNIHLQ